MKWNLLAASTWLALGLGLAWLIDGRWLLAILCLLYLFVVAVQRRLRNARTR